MENAVEREKIEVKRTVQFEPEKGEIRVLGVRCYFINPVSSCEKVDKLFGTGGEVIVHNVCFEGGYKFFNDIIKGNPSKPKRDLLTNLVAAAPELGYGMITTATLRESPPTVKVSVVNPATKTVKGSQKYLMGSFWAGVFSKYFDRQLTCKDFSYDEGRDELSFVIST